MQNQKLQSVQRSKVDKNQKIFGLALLNHMDAITMELAGNVEEV